MGKDRKSDVAQPVLDSQDFEAQLLLKNRALSAVAEGITISDPSLPDNPIIYANEGFERLTGYAVSDVLGRNCRFLQGPDTEPETVEAIRQALREEREITVQILNYRSNGEPFWNRLSITPVRDSAGRLTNYIGVQSDITELKRVEEELRQAKQNLETVNRQLRDDLEAAADVQRALLPSGTPEVPGLEVVWTLRPCQELAGDILNIYRLDERHVVLYLVDVSGHGVAAALSSVTVSRLLSANSRRAILFKASRKGAEGPLPAAPAVVAARLHDHFQFDTRTAQFFTLFYGVLDTATSSLRYVSAGHPPPIWLAKNRPPQFLATTGPPVGLLPNPDFEDTTLGLREGDRLYLYTDGVTEAEDARGRELGRDRLLERVAAARDLPLRESVDDILAAIDRWCGHRSPADDLSLLALEVSAADDD